MIDPYRMVLINILSLLVVGSATFFYSKIYPKKKINLFVLLITISLLPLISLLRKGTYESGDLTLHSVFLRSFYESLLDGNVIPEWAGYLCGGKGCPVFIFEYIAPFYIGSLFHFLGFSYINSIKLLLGFSFILSGIGMYVFVKNELDKIPAFVASLFYLFAPFHLEELHFRVGIGMVLAFTIVPYLFLSSKKLVENKSKIKFIVLNALCLLLLIMSHSTITILILPLLFIYTFVILINCKKRKILHLINLTISIVLGLGLSSFYWLPALKEIQYTWYLKNLIVNDFKPIQDYIFSPTLYGFLFQGHNGELRLIIGYPHLFVLTLAVFFLIKKKLPIKYKIFILYLMLSFVVFFFLLLKVSMPIWNNIPLLKSSVLPWRVLMPIAFVTSFVAGVITKYIKKKTLIILLCVFVVSSTLLNWGNRKMIPEDPNAYNTHWSLYTEYYEENDLLLKQNYTKNIAYAPSLVLNKPKSHIEIIEGEGFFTELMRTSTKHSYVLNAKTDVIIKENTFYFPGWKMFSNYNELPIVYNEKNSLGIITTDLKRGLHKIDVIFTDSPIRKISKLISLLTLGLLGFYWIYYFLHKRT